MPQVLNGAANGAAVPCNGAEQLRLFDVGGVDLAGLRMERAAIAASQQAANTTRGYRADWADFRTWCESAGRASLPATSDTVQLYLVSQARLGRLMATIERRCSSIAFHHLSAGHKSPIDEDVREVLHGLRRKLGTAPKHV